MSTASARSVTNESASRRIYLITAVYSAVLYTVLLVAPVIAFPLVSKYDLEPSQTGLLFSCELGAFSLATIPAYLWLNRIPLMRSVGVCTIIVVLGNLVSGFVPSFEVLIVVRVITSLAAGSITVVLLALGPRSDNPGRAFGLFVVCQLVMGAIILAVFPVLYAGVDVAAMYWTLAGLTLICFLFLPLFRGLSLTDSGITAPDDTPRQIFQATQSVALDRRRVPAFIAGLVSILCFYIALSGVWTFMGQLSTQAGNSENATSIVLMIATLAGIASALLATVLGSSPRRRIYLLAGFLVLCASVLALFGQPALIRFAIAAVLFKFGWTFVLPYLLGSVSALGGGPHTMNTVNLFIGGGFAIGPIIAGSIIAGPSGFAGMLSVSFAVLVTASIGAAVLTRVQPTPEKRAGESPATPVA